MIPLHKYPSRDELSRDARLPVDNGGGGYSGRDLLCACLLPCVLAAIVIVAVSNLATYFSVSKVYSSTESQYFPFRLIYLTLTQS